MQPPQGGKALRRTSALASIALALLVLFTGGRRCARCATGWACWSAVYRLEGIRPALSLQGVLADAALTDHQPTRERIILPRLRLALLLGRETVAALTIEEKKIASGRSPVPPLPGGRSRTGSALRALLGAFRRAASGSGLSGRCTCRSGSAPCASICCGCRKPSGWGCGHSVGRCRYSTRLLSSLGLLLPGWSL
jgi:hypothetical protein